MDAIKKSLVEMNARQNPELYNAIAQLVQQGQKKRAIMAAVAKHAPKSGITYGLCDATCDYFLSSEGRAAIENIKNKTAG